MVFIFELVIGGGQYREAMVATGLKKTMGWLIPSLAY